MGSRGVECLQGAHYGRKEPRGQVPAARAAADRLRPAEPSKPLQPLHHLNHTASPSGVPHPARLLGRPWAAPEGSWDTLPAAAQLSASRGPDLPEGHYIRTPLNHTLPRLADGGPAAHAHSGYTPRLRAHRHTPRTREWLGAARPQARDSEHRVGSHAAPEPVAGEHCPGIPRETWQRRERPWDGKGDAARGSGWDPAPPSGAPQRQDHRGSRYAPPAGSPRPQHLPRHPPSAAWLLRPGHDSRFQPAALPLAGGVLPVPLSRAGTEPGIARLAPGRGQPAVGTLPPAVGTARAPRGGRRAAVHVEGGGEGP